MDHRPIPCAVDTDPYFDPRSLKHGYNDWHHVTVPLEDREPIKDVAVTLSYFAHVAYTDAGDMKVERVELMTSRSLDDMDRGRSLKAHPSTALTPAQIGILTLLRADAESESGRIEIDSVIAAHQAERDADDFDF